MALRIEDYAIIGDCETAALVGRDGSIDWLSCPRFDSDACFTALLGTEEHGRWRIAPTADAVDVTRCYRDSTLILETTFETAEGAATVIDFMPQRGANAHLVRLVRGDRGRVEFCSELILRMGYGKIVPWVTKTENGDLRAVAGPDMLLLRSSVPLHGENFKTVGSFTVTAGVTASFVMSYARSHLPDPPEVDPDRLLEETEQFWRGWSGACKIDGPHADIVKRSVITLKALTYTPTGGVVAAATTSLPEKLGGKRNWDYRYCWLRDATFTLLAFMNTGYYEEAGAWRDWLLRAVAGSPEQMQIMYGVGGERRLQEFDLPWLPGYESSGPVLVGNEAHQQMQLDVYGEVLDALHQARKGSLAPDSTGWDLCLKILDHLEENWRKADHGIWETRSDPKQFTYSKVMAWVAYDRAVKSVEAFGLPGPVERWRKIRHEIHADVCKHGYDHQLGSFVRAYGSKHVDASLLLLPALGFLPPDDERIRGTVRFVEKTLLRDGFVLRYDTESADDGLPPGEGVFIACTFWLVDAYVLLGRLTEARELFERLLALCNDVGLLSEEYAPESGRLIGNFPQAFSHLALVNSACYLSRSKDQKDQRADSTDSDDNEEVARAIDGISQF